MGGLNDTGPTPKCVLGTQTTGCNTLWQTPHASHNNGKEVDIAVSNLGAVTLKLLLRQVILDNKYGNNPAIAHCEGDVNLVTPVSSCKSITGNSNGLATHIHVVFGN
jgi:hypothetical protein